MKKEINYIYNKYKIYAKINLMFWILGITIFNCLMIEEISNIVSKIFAIFFIPSLIIHIIVNNKRRYYKKNYYNLYIKESAIKDTINDINLKG